MKGSYQISVQNNKVKYEFTIRRNQLGTILHIFYFRKNKRILSEILKKETESKLPFRKHKKQDS